RVRPLYQKPAIRNPCRYDRAWNTNLRSSEAVGDFQIPEIAVFSARVDGACQRMTLRVAVVARQRALRIQVVIYADVVQGGESAIAVGRPTDVAEGPWLECSA